MTRLETRPWSEDDALLESYEGEPGVVASSIGDSEPIRADAVRSSAAAGSGVRAGRGKRVLTPQRSLLPLVIGLVWIAGAGLALDLTRSGNVWICLIGAGLAMLAAAVISLFEGGSMTTAVSTMERLLTTAPGTNLAGVNVDTVPSRFKRMFEMMHQYVQEVRVRLEEAIERQRRLSLEYRVAVVEREQCEAIVRGISDAVMVVDQFERLAYANPAAEQLFGLSAEKDRRRPLHDLIRQEELLIAARQCRESSALTARRSVEIMIEDRAYKATLSGVACAANAIDSENASGVVLMLRDVTREKEIARAKSDFVSKVAHELRTPLSSIKAYVEMLVDGEADDEKTRREYYEIISTSSDRLGRLIDNMLNISRIESGTVRVNKEPVSFATLVKEAVDVMRPLAEARQIMLVEELTPVFYQIHADRDLMSQAVLNLISNAIKYTPEGGKVTVRVTISEQDRTVSASVMDTGVGIPEEDLPKMFEKFFRVKANSKMAKGTGLGLNLVKHVVETVHSGRVDVASQVNQGSTFTITLPLAV
jgi:two-component system phosphate regulon sensor histidine kinase PhoR